MKLARPDVFHPRIVFASYPSLPHGDDDDAELVGALRHRGLHARWLSWDDPDTLAADLVILRSTWDYTQRLEEFLGWTRRVANLLNPPQVVAWNTDKRYLHDLADAGVATVPSAFFMAGKPIALPDGEVVVKPTVGAGSIGAQRFTDPTAAHAHAAALQRDGHTVLVQPYDNRVADGETALVYLGGRPSHAFRKLPILPPSGSPRDRSYGKEPLHSDDVDFELWDVGYAALHAAASQCNVGVETLLYARVDILGGRDDPRLLELELVEPSLGWRQLAAPDRMRRQREFAIAVETALERLGLGPLSHRRP